MSDTDLETLVSELKARIDQLESNSTRAPAPEPTEYEDYSGRVRNRATGQLLVGGDTEDKSKAAERAKALAQPAKRLKRLSAEAYYDERFWRITHDGKLLEERGYSPEAIEDFRQRYIESRGAERLPAWDAGGTGVVNAEGQRADPPRRGKRKTANQMHLGSRYDNDIAPTWKKGLKQEQRVQVDAPDDYDPFNDET